jgi:hypothetical protein
MDIGDKIQVTNTPAFTSTETINQMVRGYTEIFDQFEHTMVLNCVPESPYEVGSLDDPTLGHLDTDGSTLQSDMAPTDVTFVGITTNPNSPIWLPSLYDTPTSSFPIDIRMGGEIMRVTNIVGTTSPQTFTVTRSINGVVKSQTAGTSFSLAHPLIVSL